MATARFTGLRPAQFFESNQRDGIPIVIARVLAPLELDRLLVARFLGLLKKNNTIREGISRRGGIS